MQEFTYIIRYHANACISSLIVLINTHIVNINRFGIENMYDWQKNKKTYI